MKPYPSFVCAECGRKAQKDKRKMHSISTMHKGVCEVCTRSRMVTAAIDFGYPKFKGYEPKSFKQHRL